MATVSKDAEAVLSGVDQATRDAIIGQAPGGKLTSGEASRLLSSFKVSGSPYSSPNIASAVSAPATRPDYNDPLAMRDFYLNELGVPQAQTDVKTLTDQINQFDTTTQESLNALENQPLRMGVITGEQAATARSASTTRESIARELAAKTSFLDSARQEANTRLQLKQEEIAPVRELILKTGGKAGITVYDNLETASQKAYDFQVKESEKAKKEEEKASLKDLYIKTFGAPPKKGASAKDIRKKLEKQAKEDKNTKNAMDSLDKRYKEAQISNLLDKSSGSGDKEYESQKENLYKDVDNMRKMMSDGSANWAIAWNTLNNKYPGFSPDEIDEFLGIDYRNQFDKSLE